MPRDESVLNLASLEGSASGYGVVGMVGVVWQWTSSPERPYPFSPVAADPAQDFIILRGGGYANSRTALRCANRYAEMPAGWARARASAARWTRSRASGKHARWDYHGPSAAGWTDPALPVTGRRRPRHDATPEEDHV